MGIVTCVYYCKSPSFSIYILQCLTSSQTVFKILVYALIFRWIYNLIRYYFYNVDVDECGDDTDGCSQTCTNTEGSFTCGCTDGYVLNVDGTTCDGMHIVLT